MLGAWLMYEERAPGERGARDLNTTTSLRERFAHAAPSAAALPASACDARAPAGGELTNQNFASSLLSLSALAGGFTLPKKISSGVTFRP
jgi:hypothetical protein